MIASALRQLALTRDKADTLLLLSAMLGVVALHFVHLPWWISLLCCITLLYRASVTFRGKRMPSAWVLLPVVIISTIAVFWSYDRVLGRDSGIAMLVLLVAFKTLEMRARRDLFVVINLGLFLVLGNFFYSQSIGTAVAMVGSVILLLTAQSTFQYTGYVPSLARRFRMAAVMVGVALPLTVLVFIFFPRIQGPLWGMPGDATAGKAGLAESMSPGNLSRLAESGEVAFRVRFFGQHPQPHQLYWRAMVYAMFDGRTWSRGQRLPVKPVLTVRGAPTDYEVTLEPHDRRFLFVLDVPGGLPSIPTHEPVRTPELEVSTTEPITNRTRYRANSYLDYELGDIPIQISVKMWLDLPVRGNPQAYELGRSLRALPPADRINAVFKMFREQEFIYTLEPPPLGRDTVDEFLFGTRAGFCEHFAGSFVYLMRAAQVPARVVAGYQGGELNPVDGYYTVRQSDAHAWAEVFLAGRGWVRVDPTAAVAPNRIRSSLGDVIPDQGFGLEKLIEANSPTWLTNLRYQLSAINNRWNQWVLNYNPQRQAGFIDTLSFTFGNVPTMIGLAAIMLLIYLLLLLRQRNSGDPGDRMYAIACARLARAGVERNSDEGPATLAARVSAIHMPAERQRAALEFLAAYSAYKYAQDRANPADLAAMKNLLNEFR
jgi:transglutaminase-like putative cysteine protease